MQKLVSLIRCHLFIFAFITVEGGSKNLAAIYVKECPMLSSKSFTVSLIHFEFMLVYDVRECSNFLHLHIADQYSPYHFQKRVSFIHCIFLPLFS